MGVDGPRTVCDGYGQPDKSGAPGHLRTEGCRGGQKTVVKQVRLRLCEAGANRRTARPGDLSCSDSRASLGRIFADWIRGLLTTFIEELNSLFSAVKRKAHLDRPVDT